MSETSAPAMAASPPPSAAGQRPQWLAPLLAMLAISAAYVRVTAMSFVYDDVVIVHGDRFIQSPRYIPRYFTEHIWSYLMASAKNYYRPSFLLWLLGNYTVFQERPLGWHLTNLALHLGSCLLIYFLALRLTRSRFAALAAMLLFGLHPIQVETVSWVSASTELLGTFLALSAFVCYLRGVDSPARPRPWLLASIFLYALAALAKETVLIYPGVVFLHEWLGRPAAAKPLAPRPFWQSFHAAMQEMAPFFFVAIGYLAMRLYALGSLGHHVLDLSVRTSLLTVPYVLESYVVHLLWPAGLSCFYDSDYVTTLSPVKVFLPLIVALTVLVLLFAAVRKSPAGLLASFWLLLPLLPVLDVRVFPRNEFVHDRYFYHPMIGVSFLAAIAIAHLERGGSAERGWWLSLRVGTLAILAALGVVSFLQTAYWKDNYALYTRGVEVAPHNAFAHNNLGGVLLEQQRWEEAVAHLQAALVENPELYLAEYDLGIAYYEEQQFADAEAHFTRAVRIQPKDAGSHFFLGMTYLHTGRLELAIAEARRALALNPYGAGYHFALGVMLKQAGDASAARAEFLNELERDPQHQASLEQLRLLGPAPAPQAAPK